MDGAGIIVGDAGRARGGDQEDALWRRDYVFFASLLRIAAERAGELAAGLADLAQAAHGLADEGYRRYAEVRRQSAIGADDAEGSVVDDDVVTDGIDIFDPLALGAFELRES